jgi:hypothetical protein
MGIGTGRQIDLGPRDVQETQRITGRKRPRFGAVDDVVGHRRHAGRSIRHRP